MKRRTLNTAKRNCPAAASRWWVIFPAGISQSQTEIATGTPLANVILLSAVAVLEHVAKAKFYAEQLRLDARDCSSASCMVVRLLETHVRCKGCGKERRSDTTVQSIVAVDEAKTRRILDLNKASATLAEA